ncbi:MAG TPA: adenosylhomocysteinase [Synergistaceae bacterium]|nr:adenosylhomocysteinase [Synergistaceae bacterium]
MTLPEYNIADRNLAPQGKAKIDWAWQYMPVLRMLEERLAPEKPLEGKVLSVCLHLEAKTACLLRTLKRLGATVAAAGSNPLSTQDDVCAALVDEGIHVFSTRGMTSEMYMQNLRSAAAYDPEIIIDDGCDLVCLVHEERPELCAKIRGGCEETTTGVKRLKAMAEEKILAFPMYAVNDAYSKYLFDNRYGTGQSVWDAIMRTTNCLVAGKSVVVAGYGWCGRGVASRASGMGASVIVVEADPHRALEALMDGYRVMSMAEAAPLGDFFITVTGNVSVIRGEHMDLLKDGVILANAGHFDVEISKPHLEERSSSVETVRPGVTRYAFKDGRKIYLLAEGRLVNLAAGDGHPIEIMDLSFAMQLLTALHVLHTSREPGVYNVPEELDKEVGALKLESLGIALEKFTPEQEQYMKDWRE